MSRRGYQDATGDYASNLSVTLSDEKSTVINLSFKDVCIQRAEDVLNTVIAVYNENWIKDKNQIAVSTSAFISDRLGVIEQELGNVDENISSYKSEHLLPDVQAAASMYMEQSSETNAQILALNTQLSMARYIRNYLTNSTSKNQLLPANSGIESPGIEQQILAILRDIKKDIDNGEQPGEAVTAAMFQAMRDALAEQKQNPLSIDDVAAMVAGQIGQLTPMDEETADLFKQLAKKMMKGIE